MPEIKPPKIAHKSKSDPASGEINETSIEDLDSDIDVNIKIAYLEVMLRFAKRYVRWADLFSGDENAKKAAREMNDKYQNMLDKLHSLEGATVSGSDFDPN